MRKKTLFGVVLLSLCVASVGMGMYLRTNKIAGQGTAQQSADNASSIDKNTDVFWLAEKGTPAQLQEAARHGAKFNVERNIYDMEDEDYDIEGWLFDHGETPLHRAATYNHNPESIRFLIAQGVDVNAEASMGNSAPQTPLICAVRKNTVEIIRELLKGGANPNHPDTENIFNVATDARGNDIASYKEIVEALVEAGGNLNSHWEVKPEERKSVLLPRSQWSSSNPRDNTRDDLSNAEVQNFMASCTVLMDAVLSDNPDVVDILLDLKADATVRNMENKLALDYANELPENSKLKRSPVFARLKAATGTSASTSAVAKAPGGAKTKDKTSAEQLERLVNEGKVPAYVGDKGEFSYDPGLNSIIVTGDGVRLRSQPNTKANVVEQLDKQMWGSIDYLGTWKHPDGSRWNIGLFDDWSYYPEETPENEKKVVFVSAQYSKAVTNKEYRDFMAAKHVGGSDAGWENDLEVTNSNGNALIAQLKTKQHYYEFQEEYGFAPIGQMLDRLFINPTWEVIKTTNALNEAQKKAFSSNFVLFKGFGNAGRMDILFGKLLVNRNDFKKGDIIPIQISVNGKRKYHYTLDVGRGFSDLDKFTKSGHGLTFGFQELVNTMGAIAGQGSNEYTWYLFCKMIYDANLRRSIYNEMR